MEKEAIIRWASDKMGAADDSPMEYGYRLHHGRRVALLAVKLAKNMNLAVNTDVLYVAGVLHDVGKAGGQPSAGHGPRGAEIIRAEVPHLFSAAELTAVCDIVANHYMRPRSKRFAGQQPPDFPPETLLIQDADLLDHYGSIGVFINMYWSAGQKESPQQMLEWRRNNAADAQSLSQPLNYDMSKVEFYARYRRERKFFEFMAIEEAGGLTYLA